MTSVQALLAAVGIVAGALVPPWLRWRAYRARVRRDLAVRRLLLDKARTAATAVPESVATAAGADADRARGVTW